GYYPRKEPSGTTNPASVIYTITGDEDIMATGVQTGSLVDKFETFTFSHLLTQLQFKCVGSAGAISKWTAVASIKVKNVATGLKLSLDKTSGAKLTATGTTDQTLTVKNCPSTISALDAETPPTCYLLLYPTANMGTESLPVSLEVKGTYDGSAKTLNVTVSNIGEGVKAGYSHLITLTFTEDGKIVVESGIAEWQPGNNGSTIVTPGE
uniref:fimbrillin family protein n=1 Tax=Parabacteroides goldsteinii TaxID=328812 RepID=UPI00243013CA